MNIRYLYHSGFAIEADGCTVVIDYYDDECVPPRRLENGVVDADLLSRPGKFYVLSSHGHRDHFNPVIMSWQEQRRDIQYLLSSDLHASLGARENTLFLAPGESYNDGTLSVLAFGSTDLGVSFLLRIEDKILLHAGDLNNWHWENESSAEYVAQAQADYLAILQKIAKAAPQLDAALFPVDPRMGANGGRGAEQLTAAIRVGALLPMHFGNDFSFPASYAKAHPEQAVAVWSHRVEVFAL